MSRRHQVHANLVEAIARGDADWTGRLIAGSSLPTASDADRWRLPGGRRRRRVRPACRMTKTTARSAEMIFFFFSGTDGAGDRGVCGGGAGLDAA
jgi:hypothetical protein